MEVPKVKKTVYLTSKQDGLKLHVLLMEPEEEPKESYRLFMEWQSTKNGMSHLWRCYVNKDISV